MSFIPKIAEDTDPRWVKLLRTRSEEMVGKTIKEVSCGMREHDDEANQSQVLVIEFTDDSILHIHTASNAGNIVQDVNSLGKSCIKESDFQADLFLVWENLHSNKS